MHVTGKAIQSVSGSACEEERSTHRCPIHIMYEWTFTFPIFVYFIARER